MTALQFVALFSYGGFLLATFGWRAVLSRRGRGGGLSVRKPVSAADATGEITCLVGCLLSLLAPLFAMMDVVLPVSTTWPAIQGLVSVAVGASGVTVAIAAQRHLGSSWRTGVEASSTLVTSGPFAWVRNPFYVGWFLAAAAVVVAVPSLVASAGFILHVIAAHVIVRAVEEPVLTGAHGTQYLRYKRRTGRFVPRPPL